MRCQGSVLTPEQLACVPGLRGKLPYHSAPVPTCEMGEGRDTHPEALVEGDAYRKGRGGRSWLCGGLPLPLPESHGNEGCFSPHIPDCSSLMKGTFPREASPSRGGHAAGGFWQQEDRD